MAGLYGGDYLSARYRIPGNRQTLGSVEVQTFYAVRQKDGRIEYLLGASEVQSCLRSLFPHLGYAPCWYLSRHATKRIEVSRAATGVERSSGARPAPAGTRCPGPWGENAAPAVCAIRHQPAPSRFRNRVSSIIRNPNARALVSLLPASSPAST